MPEGQEENILKGMYRFQEGKPSSQNYSFWAVVLFSGR